MNRDVSFHPETPNPVNHPDEDVLERYLLRQSDNAETEMIETHFLACEVCVERLETLESLIQITKVALQPVLGEQTIKPRESIKDRVGWFRWLTLPRLGFASAGLAACAALAMFVLIPRNVEVVANRGVEATTVSMWMPVQLTLDARDLPSGPVSVEVVTALGKRVWQGSSNIDNGTLQLSTLRLTAAGNYLARVFTRSDNEELREYAIKVTNPLK